MKLNGKFFVAGHRGMVGSGIVRALQKNGYHEIVTRTHAELDLTSHDAVKNFFDAEQPDYVILAAAKVGGIEANRKYNAEFLLENLAIQNNVIDQAYRHHVKKFCFLGSSCIYPCACPQPIKEEYLLTGPLEPTNEGYALAKIAGYKLGYFLSKQYGFNAISLMPCNLYGTNDNYDPVGSHVFPALIRRFVEAVDNHTETVTLWGTGVALREFMHVDDLADAVMLTMENWNDPEFLNVGTGTEITIRELAETIASAAGFQGKITWDAQHPDGMKCKCMDTSRIRKLGFSPKVSLREGIERTIAEYRQLKREGRIRQC